MEVATRITLQKNSHVAQFSSAHLNYIPKMCVILGAITMNFFRFFKNCVFSKNQFVWKKNFFVIKFGILNYWKRARIYIYIFCLSHNFLNNAWKNRKFWVSSLFMLVYQSLKFQVNQKHGALNPSDLAWNIPYIVENHTIF